MMDGASSYSSSKVTVEYHDPAGVFALLSPQLQARLPLRNLHWKSPTRPLRSIDSLHVELVSGEDGIERPPTAASQDSLASQDGPRISQAHDGLGPGLQPFRPLGKERRHQIPGLRRTPYLKVYLLRCDDSETYKTTTRKQIREWLRANAPLSHDSKSHSAQEKHDAFEWLIVHVVVPNTPASAQPRFSGSTSSSTGMAKDRSSSTRWPGGKSTTIFEKIRSDFNSSSSHAPDRVAQVRIQNDEIPDDRQFPSSVFSITPWQESPQERASAWADVVGKFKTLILNSFDLRVSQYEDDIREKDSQRSLPGWNFCTFFVLKEGLAQSFEGVGLVEDALVIYDELSLGLDTVIQDKAAGRAETDATIFLDSTEELKEALQGVLDSEDVTEPAQHLMGKPISERNKPYREKIVSSNISIFDFKCYLFARQIVLLVRLGKQSIDLMQTPRTPRNFQDTRRNSFDEVARKRSFESAVEEDLSALAEICRRTLSFVTNVARVLRFDLANNVSDGKPVFSRAAVANIAASWTVAVIEQVLSETSASLVDSALGAGGATQAPLSPLKLPKARASSKSGEIQPLSAENKLHPARSSSLSFRPSSMVEPGSAQTARRDSSERGRLGDLATRFGFVELCTHRADLYLVERRTLEQLGNLLRWQVGWAALEQAQKHRSNGLGEFKISRDTGLSQKGAPSESKSNAKSAPLQGVCHSMLIQATASPDDFRKQFEILTDNVIKLHLAAGQTRSVENMLGDLAIMRYDSGDYAGAASLFSRVTPLFAECKWNHVEVAVLRLHAQCLKTLNRRDDYVRILLLILSKAAARSRSAKTPKARELPSPGMRRAIDSSLSWLDDDDIQAHGTLNELLEYSEELPYDVSVPMAAYFSDITVEPYVLHYDDRDGFRLKFSFRHLLDDGFIAESVQLRLVTTSAEQKRDIVLSNDGSLPIETGITKCMLHTNVTTFGSFFVERITLKAKKIAFVYEPLSTKDDRSPLSFAGAAHIGPAEFPKRSHIFCFPRAESLGAKICLSRYIHIDKTRSVEVECSSGWNDADKIEIRLRAASAGLRLHTAEATIVDGPVELVWGDNPQPGLIELERVPSNTTFRVRVPYELESHLPDILIRLDVDYQSANGAFQFFSNSVIPIDLPLDVNVQDTFKPAALFSTFNVRTPDYRPLRLLSAKLGESSSLSVQGPMGGEWPRLVLPRRVMSLQFILKQKQTDQTGLKEPLALDIDYQCLNEQIEAVVETTMDTAISNSDFAHLRGLVVTAFTQRFMSHLSESDFSTIATSDELTLPPFSAFGWDDVLKALPPAPRSEFAQWLSGFHNDHSKLLLGNINDWSDMQALYGYPDAFKPLDSSRTTRHITIAVEIPTAHIISTASLSIHGHLRDYVPSESAWPVGEARTATLVISHTRKWCSPEDLQRAAELDTADDPIQFIYELNANPDLWLIGGSRQGTFWQKEGESQKIQIDILLVPLQKGKWAFPGVDVRAVQPLREKAQVQAERRGSLAAAETAEDGVLCECYYEDSYQRALVVSNVKSATVGLMGDGGTMLLDATSVDM